MMSENFVIIAHGETSGGQPPWLYEESEAR